MAGVKGNMQFLKDQNLVNIPVSIAVQKVETFEVLLGIIVPIIPMVGAKVNIPHMRVESNLNIHVNTVEQKVETFEVL